VAKNLVSYKFSYGITHTKINPYIYAFIDCTWKVQSGIELADQKWTRRAPKYLPIFLTVSKCQ
jgi:hypothetical protein